MNAKSKTPSAFALAQERFSICAEISAADVQAIRPDWTHEQAVAFLREHGDDIGREMAIHGTVLLAAMIRGGPDGN